MKRVMAVLAAATMLSGCTHVHPSDPTAPGLRLEDLNQSLEGRTVSVTLLDGTEFGAASVVVRVDTTSLVPQGEPSWKPPTRAALGRAFPTSEVESLTVTQRGRGAFEGGMLGLLIGAVAGAVVGAASYEPSSGDFESGPGSSGEAAVGYGLIFGVVGAGVGLVAGASVGSSDVYDLTEAPEDRPTGSRRRGSR